MDDVTKNSEQQKQDEIVANDQNDSSEVSLEELVKNTVKEAEAEKKAMPSPETARLTYSAYADMRPCPESIYAPLGIWSYIGMFILFSLPVLGLVAAIIYAAASKKLARRRPAAAAIILQIVVTVLLAAAIIISELVYDLDILRFIGNFLIEISYRLS